MIRWIHRILPLFSLTTEGAEIRRARQTGKDNDPEIDSEDWGWRESNYGGEGGGVTLALTWDSPLWRI